MKKYVKPCTIQVEMCPNIMLDCKEDVLINASSVLTEGFKLKQTTLYIVGHYSTNGDGSGGQHQTILNLDISCLYKFGGSYTEVDNGFASCGKNSSQCEYNFNGTLILYKKCQNATEWQQVGTYTSPSSSNYKPD